MSGISQSLYCVCSKELLGLNFTRKYVDLPVLCVLYIYNMECTVLWRLNKQDNKIGKELKP